MIRKIQTGNICSIDFLNREAKNIVPIHINKKNGIEASILSPYKKYS
jgi:hypothetical protein